jgi:predicted porin
MAIPPVHRCALIGAASLLIPALAHAAAADSAPPDPTSSPTSASAAAPAEAKAKVKDDSLTFHGITLYGVVDVGVAYQSHGAKLNGDFPPGLEYVVAKNSGKSLVSLAPSALSQSKIGLRGKERLTDDLSAVFQLETQFVPTSGRLADGPGSLVRNNGRPLAAQSANGDSGKAGQDFAGQAWAGLASKSFGTLTFGRHYNLFLDDVIAYDPMAASHAFSIVGYFGSAQAGASTEDSRLDNSLRYALKKGSVRLVGLYELGGRDRPDTRAYQFDLGYDLPRGSVDLTYGHINDSVSASPLTAAQRLTAPHDSLAASVSDNTAFGAFAKFDVTRSAKFFAAYEHIEYENPRHPLAVGDNTIGDYVLGVVNNAAFPNHRHVDFIWTGVRYAVAPKVELTLAYYRENQNSYGAVSCSISASPRCSGDLQALSALAVLKVTKRWNLYSGAMYSQVANGLASGFLNRSSVDPMAGVRLSF